MPRLTNKCCPTCDSHFVRVLRTELPAEPRPRPHAPVINHTACAHCGRRGVLVTTMREHLSSARGHRRLTSDAIAGRWELEEVDDDDDDEDDADEDDADEDDYDEEDDDDYEDDEEEDDDDADEEDDDYEDEADDLDEDDDLDDRDDEVW